MATCGCDVQAFIGGSGTQYISQTEVSQILYTCEWHVKNSNALHCYYVLLVVLVYLNLV